MTNLESIFKSRDITLPTKVHLVKAMVFSSSHVWIWELDYKESWALKNWCFWIVGEDSWESLGLQGDWLGESVHPKGNQSWIFIGRTDAEAETQSFGHLMWRTDSLVKTLMPGKTEGRRRSGQQRMRWLDGITDSMDMSLSKLWELVIDRENGHAPDHGITKIWTRLSDWTVTMKPKCSLCSGYYNHCKVSFFLCSRIFSVIYSCYSAYGAAAWAQLGASEKWRAWDTAPDPPNQICMFPWPPGGTAALKFEKHWLCHSKAPPSRLNLIDAQLMPAPLGEDVSLCLVFYSLANQELRPRLGFCHSFLGQASSRWCSLPGKSNSGQFYPANNHPAQSPTVALTGGWSISGSRRIRWFRMSMLGPALWASAENSSWDIVTLIHTHPSFCSECF